MRLMCLKLFVVSICCEVRLCRSVEVCRWCSLSFLCVCVVMRVIV